MAGAHFLERLHPAPPHLVGDRAVSQDALRGDEAREHRSEPRDASLAVAADESLMQVGRDDAQLRPELEDVPVVAAEDADRRRVIRQRKRTLFVGEQPNQNGLTCAVRPEDGRVLACADFQRQPVKDGGIAFLDAGIE